MAGVVLSLQFVPPAQPLHLHLHTLYTHLVKLTNPPPLPCGSFISLSPPPPHPPATVQLRPTPGREVTALSPPTGINETFHNPDDSLDVHAAHVNGTLDTHGSTTKPLDFSLDQGSVHDAGEFKEFVHHDVRYE